MNLPRFRRTTVVVFTTVVLLTGYPAYAQKEAPRPATEADAEVALEQGRNAPAIAIYTKLITQTPKKFKLYLGRGIAYYKAKQYDKAALDFTSFIRLRPALIDGYLYRAYAYKELGRYKEALADLAKVDALSPKSESARHLREELRGMIPTP